MLLRIRSNVGIWRISDIDETTGTISDVIDKIAISRPNVVYNKPLSKDPACEYPLDTVLTLSEQGIQHGTMIHCRVDPTTCVEQKQTITTTTTNDNNNTTDKASSSVTDDRKPAAAAAATATSAAGSLTTGGGGGVGTTTTTSAAAGSGSGGNMRRIIDKDGSIKLVPNNTITQSKHDRGFRKGLLPLRDMKMSWTLSDFVALDSQYEFKMKRQTKSICKQVSIDMQSLNQFQLALSKFQFHRKRFGYLYGKYVDVVDDDDDDDHNVENKGDGNSQHDKKKKKPTKKKTDDEKKRQKTDSTDDALPKRKRVVVEAIYEPPQEVDNESAEGFIPIDDPADDERVSKITSMLGLQKVGWIYGHEQRKAGYVMSAAEIIMAAEMQLEAANGIHETPFVTVKVAPGNKTDDNNNNNNDAKMAPVSVEAFQVSQQCMSMVAEEALEIGSDPTVCVINETFTAIQEGKASKTVENNFFLTVVPIVQHTSENFITEFPKLHRDTILEDDTSSNNNSSSTMIPSHDAMKKQLSKAGHAGWTFEDRLADLNLLLYLSQFLDIDHDMPKICSSIIKQQHEEEEEANGGGDNNNYYTAARGLDDGYKLLIKSMAGMDGSY